MHPHANSQSPNGQGFEAFFRVFSCHPEGGFGGLGPQTDRRILVKASKRAKQSRRSISASGASWDPALILSSHDAQRRSFARDECCRIHALSQDDILQAHPICIKLRGCRVEVGWLGASEAKPPAT